MQSAAGCSPAYRRYNMATFKVQVSFGLLNPTLTGERTVDVRSSTWTAFAQARIGDHIVYNDKVTVVIVNIRRYSSIKALLREIDSKHIVPGFTKEELRANLQAHMPEVGKDGVHAIAFSIRPLRT